MRRPTPPAQSLPSLTYTAALEHDLDIFRHVDVSTFREGFGCLPSSSQLQVSSQAKQVRARQAPQRPTCVPALQHFTPLPGFHRPLPGLSDASQKAELSMCGKECWGLFGLRAIAYVQSAPSAHKLPKTQDPDLPDDVSAAQSHSSRQHRLRDAAHAGLRLTSPNLP